MRVNSSESSEGYGISLPELYRLLIQHRLKMALVFVTGMVLTVVAMFVMPRVYRSEARILIRVGRSTVGLDPSATLGQTNPIHKAVDSEVLSVQSTMYSRTVMEKTVDTLTPEYILAEGAPGEVGVEETESGPGLMGRVRGVAEDLGLVDPATARDAAIRTLETSFNVYVDTGSSVLIAEMRANHCERAQRILQVMLDHAQEMHLNINRTAGEHDFFVEQLRVLELQWKEKADELQRFKNDRNLASIDGKRRGVEEQIRSIETDILMSTSNLHESLAMIDSLQRQFDQVPERYSSTEVSGVSNNASDQLMQTYYNLLIMEAELASRYTPENPKLLQVRRQLEAAERAVAKQPTSRTEVTEAVNPTRVTLELQLVTERAKNESLRARLTSLKEQLAGLHQEVAELNQDEQRLTDLQQQVETLAAKAKKYNDDVEQARIISAMETHRISNLSMIQAPTLVPRAESPKLIVILALGLALSCGGAIAIALLMEFVKRAFAADALQSRAPLGAELNERRNPGLAAVLEEELIAPNDAPRTPRIPAVSAVRVRVARS